MSQFGTQDQLKIGQILFSYFFSKLRILRRSSSVFALSKTSSSSGVLARLSAKDAGRYLGQS